MRDCGSGIRVVLQSQEFALRIRMADSDARASMDPVKLGDRYKVPTWIYGIILIVLLATHDTLRAPLELLTHTP